MKVKEDSSLNKIAQSQQQREYHQSCSSRVSVSKMLSFSWELCFLSRGSLLLLLLNVLILFVIYLVPYSPRGGRVGKMVIFSNRSPLSSEAVSASI